MSGWYAMKRGWLDHEVFEPEGRWSRAEAWIWMIEAAAYKPTAIDLGGKPYTVPRGALCFSLRFLGQRWRWSTKAVQTFLRDLEAHGVVRSEVIRGGHGGETRRTQVTLCNYEKYQSVGNARETHGKRTGNKEEQVNNTSKEEGASPPSIWDAGLAVLTARGVPDKQARSTLGKWKKLHGEETALWVTRQIERADAAEPVSYGESILNKRQPERKGFVNMGAFGEGEVVR